MSLKEDVPTLTLPIGVGDTNLGLSRFQELWAGVMCTVLFVVITIQVLYRSKQRQTKLQRVTAKPSLRVHVNGSAHDAAKRNELANASVQKSRDFKPYIPYTGRPVPGLVDIGDTREGKHPNMKDWLDFREYARYVATAIRWEVYNLGGEGVINRLNGELDCHTLRDILGDLEAQAALPESIQADDGSSAFSVDTKEALNWLCNTHDRWRWGLRPGKEFTTKAEAKRFRALSQAVISHLQQLSPRCIICNTSPKSVTFNPCQHFCTCAACSTQLTTCPVCASAIQNPRKSS
eukprot:TRINITY_DN9814_c0_g1_i1.p1 TRINITY_DN9814_c0_g1~~TRINITY_DN9814_c0_g1_i1.p1  ORF type:complete len:291 (+),score=40.38 TRINITY_DN9814_c0_g1_i1:31-903(+)